MLWVLIRGASNEYPQHVFMENWRKLSRNYHQILLPNKSSDFSILCIALDKALFPTKKISIFFLFLDENISCGYSLEAPRRGTSNEYPQHMFSSSSKKTIYRILTLI